MLQSAHACHSRWGSRMSALILLTGAIGHVRGRLLSLLQLQGIPVRCVTRPRAASRDRGNATTEVVQGDVFDPKFEPLGLAGLLSWYGIYSLRQFVFAGMLWNLARAAESSDRDPAPPHDVASEATAPEAHRLGAQL